MMKKILITGAAGTIGTSMRKLLKGHYSIRSSDIRKADKLESGEEFVQADIADYAAAERICDGMDGVVHLGGQSVEGSWEKVLNANIIGCRNIYEAAYRKGVKRVVFASSNHAIGFYPRSQRIGVDVMIKPDSRYGVSKVFGEAMGSLYADKHGLRVTCLRIGNFGDFPIDERRLSIWLSPQDCAQLVRIGLDHPDIRFEVFYGVSDNAKSWWDNGNAERFGYRPQSKAEDFRKQAMDAQAKLPPDPVGNRYQGGTYTSDGYDADKRA